MNEMKFTVEINASREKVWNTLWADETFRQWAGIIDPGTHMVGDLVEGNEVQYISGNGYGVTSLVEKLVDGEYLRLRHSADTQDEGAREREKEWTGGAESYALSENDGVTTLIAACDVPPSQEEYFTTSYPKALDEVKRLAERVDN
jgi:uncharacterized protein YndB with AHSA1/START domain